MPDSQPAMPVLTVIYALAHWGEKYGNRNIKGVKILPDNTIYIEEEV